MEACCAPTAAMAPGRNIMSTPKTACSRTGSGSGATGARRCRRASASCAGRGAEMSEPKIRIIASPDSWIEQVAIDQLERNAALPGIDRAVGLPDLHAGQGIPVGAAFWSRSHVHPHLVGSDIGCGMALWDTEI